MLDVGHEVLRFITRQDARQLLQLLDVLLNHLTGACSLAQDVGPPPEHPLTPVHCRQKGCHTRGHIGPSRVSRLGLHQGVRDEGMAAAVDGRSSDPSAPGHRRALIHSRVHTQWICKPENGLCARHCIQRPGVIHCLWLMMERENEGLAMSMPRYQSLEFEANLAFLAFLSRPWPDSARA